MVLKSIPPKGLNLNVPMSDAFKKVVASPTDSGDPAVFERTLRRAAALRDLATAKPLRTPACWLVHAPWAFRFNTDCQGRIPALSSPSATRSRQPACQGRPNLTSVIVTPGLAFKNSATLR